jgi:hypothetical protein
MNRVEQWNAKLKELYENRKGPPGEFPPRTPKDVAIEERLVAEMEGIFSEMTKEERDNVEFPPAPRIRNSLIAQDEYGRLLGYEVDQEGNELI